MGRGGQELRLGTVRGFSLFLALSQRLLQVLMLSDVSADGHKPHRFAHRVFHEGYIHLYGNRAAIFNDDLILSISDEPFCQGFLHAGKGFCPVCRDDQIKSTLSHQVPFVLGPIHFQGCFIDLDDLSFEVADDDAICRHPDGSREAEEIFLRPLALSDVACDPLRCYRLPVLVNQPEAHFERHPMAIFGDDL